MPIRTTFVFRAGKGAVSDPEEGEEREGEEQEREKREGEKREGDMVFNFVQL